MREEGSFSAPAAAGDVLDEIKAVGRGIAVVPDQLVAAVLLEVANMMCNLDIFLHAEGKCVNEGRISAGFVYRQNSGDASTTNG